MRKRDKKRRRDRNRKLKRRLGDRRRKRRRRQLRRLRKRNCLLREVNQASLLDQRLVALHQLRRLGTRSQLRVVLALREVKRSLRGFTIQVHRVAQLV